MLLPLATIVLLDTVAECLVNSKAANNFLKGKESKARDVLEEAQRTFVKKKAVTEPLDVLIKNAVLSAGVKTIDDKDNDRRSEKKMHPVFPTPIWTANKPCRENLQLWVCVYIIERFLTRNPHYF